MSANLFVNKIDNALEELKKGKLIILTDDRKRENEGDLVGLASMVTPESINYMLNKGRGLICAPMTKERANQIGLKSMVQENTEKFGTDFTVSVDDVKTITGVSAYDRALTIKSLANLSYKGDKFESPGHMFPLIANDKGLKERQGHTEAAVELAKMAGVSPVSYIIEILNEDGTMAREEELQDIAVQDRLQKISIQDIVEYQKYFDEINLKVGTTVDLPSVYGDFMLKEYKATYGDIDHPNFLVKSKKKMDKVPLVRIHSECFTGETLGSLRCECGPQLHESLRMIDREGGYLLYLRQEGRGIGIHEKLKAYVLQENNFDTYDANEVLGHSADERNYSEAVKILKVNKLTKIKLITNNPDKVNYLKENGIEVVERIPLIIGENSNNKNYLKTKKDKFNHLL